MDKQDFSLGKARTIFNNLFPKDNLKLMLWNITFMLFVLSLLARLTTQLFSTFGWYTSPQITEFLINYQGGFVRRGLMGEILLFFAKNLNINVEWTIKIICLLALGWVCFFFVRQFLQKGYSIYILPLCFFLGMGILSYYWVRKDYLFFCVFIPVLWLYNKENLSVFAKALIVNALLFFIILSHEVIVFFALPVLYVLLFNQFKTKGILQSLVLSFLWLLPSIFAFILTLLYHGDAQTAQTIWNSWTDIIDIEPSIISYTVNTIGWSSVSTFIFHFKVNFLFTDQRILSLLVWVITFPIVYYIATNALFVFRKNDTVFTNQHKTILSSLFIFQLLCLLPVFIALSCDYMRVFFYWITSSFAIFLIIPLNQIGQIFPLFFVHFVERLNNFLSKILYPTKTALVFLMMFIGISRYYCVVEWTYKSTMIFNVLHILSQPLVIIKDLIKAFLV